MHFSLNNLSMTCQLLRNVCQTQLKEKGLVIQEWVRREGRNQWMNGKNVWFFSKCFHKVKTWHFKNEGSMANHLIDCPFYQRLVFNFISQHYVWLVFLNNEYR